MTWYYELASENKIFERTADHLQMIVYFLTHKHKDDLLYIANDNMDIVWDGST